MSYMLLQVLVWLLLTTDSQQQQRFLYWQRTTNFLDPTNWSRGTVPGNSDVVTLDGGYHVSLLSSFSVNKMVFPYKSVLSLYEGGSISSAIRIPPPTHETKWLKQELQDPDNWRINSNFTLLDFESSPCIGDKLVFQRPEDLMVIQPISMSLNSIIIRPQEPNKRMEINNQSSASYLNNLYGLSIPFDNITFTHVTCQPGCDCLTPHSVQKACSFKKCPVLKDCSIYTTPDGQCCDLCALEYKYKMHSACSIFSDIYNILTNIISRHAKFYPLLKTMNVSISYIEPMMIQLTWSGISDEEVRIADEIMATVVEKNHCWKLIKTKKSLPKPQATPPSSKASSNGVGISIFFFFFFAILILAVYAMRHRIRSRYIPGVIERVEDVMGRWRGRRVANIEMGGGIIFDNSSVFDIRNEHSVGSGEETLVDNDFLAPIPTSTKSTKKAKKNSGFNNPAFQEDVKKKSGGRKKMADKEVDDKSKEKEDEQEDVGGNAFFNI